MSAWAGRVLALAALLLMVGCQPKGTPGASDAGAPLTTMPAPAATAIEFRSPEHGYRLTYPADWEPSRREEYVLNLVPRVGATGDAPVALQAISVDVPKLPPHIPGFIPLGLVVNGYIDDLKKQYADAKVESSVATKLAGSNARRVRSRWTSDGEHVEDAVLTAHRDRVYIFRLTANARDYARARDTFETVLQLVRWDN